MLRTFRRVQKVKTKFHNITRLMMINSHSTLYLVLKWHDFVHLNITLDKKSNQLHKIVLKLLCLMNLFQENFFSGFLFHLAFEDGYSIIQNFCITALRFFVFVT